MESREKRTLVVGAMMGAILGTGATLLMIKAPKNLGESEANPISTGDVLKLTGTMALFIRQLDDFRRRL